MAQCNIYLDAQKMSTRGYIKALLQDIEVFDIRRFLLCKFEKDRAYKFYTKKLRNNFKKYFIYRIMSIFDTA